MESVDVVWLIMKLFLTAFWFVVFALLALVIMYFQPVKRVMKAVFGFEFELF